MFKDFLLLGVTALLLTPTVSASAHDPFPLVLVDKATHKISLAQYVGDHIEVKKSYHVTIGKAQGDKEMENDLKTPEGVYFFTSKITPPALKKKFGNLALLTNYPNPVDKLAGKTGYAIMLHATDDPPRLKRDFDSEGCCVVDNAEIEEISREVKLGLTPIIIYPELKPEYLNAGVKSDVKEAFQKWLSAWQDKDINGYIGSYAKGFHYNGMNIKQYREYKSSLNKKYSVIDIKAENVRYYTHPKYDVVTFTQVYESKLKNGSKGFKSSGTKHVYFVKEDGGLKIADESYTSIKED